MEFTQLIPRFETLKASKLCNGPKAPTVYVLPGIDLFSVSNSGQSHRFPNPITIQIPIQKLPDLHRKDILQTLLNPYTTFTHNTSSTELPLI
jgi:hypothetical protein